MISPDPPVARHVQAAPSILRFFVPLGLVVTAIGMIWAVADVAAAGSPAGAEAALPQPVLAQALPPVQVDATEVTDHCADPAVQQALGAGDDNAVVAAFGGGAVFRSAVVTANAPCINLGDPARLWLVVNKQRGLAPAEYAPASLGAPALVRDDSAGPVRSDVAAALDQMSDAASAAGVGELTLNSGYRSYDTQVGNYSSHVSGFGQAEADAVSARPGHSEHQTGLAADVSACDPECGGILDFGGTPGGVWVAENGWQYGFVVRYEDGLTGTTGYAPEPWHLRYIGPELARAYHEGGYRSLEQFFALPDAPAYAY